MTWLGYSRIMAFLPAEVPFALTMNIILLFCVALEPYLFYVLVNASAIEIAKASSSLYALDDGVMFLVLAALSFLVQKQEKSGTKQGRMHPVVLQRFKRNMFAQSLVGAIYVMSALPFFFYLLPSGLGVLRFDMWYSAFVFFVPALIGRRTKTNATSQGG
jgi:hypothetical protein